MKMTRRQLAAVVSVSAITATPAVTQPQAAALPDELAAARERLQVPMAVEPAFQFKP